jgi:hypothetical protein
MLSRGVPQRFGYKFEAQPSPALGKQVARPWRKLFKRRCHIRISLALSGAGKRRDLCM